jgi:hypothetical protein
MKIIPYSLSEANKFVNQYHRHNKKTAWNGGKFAIGSYDDELGVVGVAIVGNPIARCLMDGFTAEVLRTCVRPDAPKNCNSFLYGACWRIWRQMGGKKLVTYTLKSEAGASLKGAGWKIIAEVKGHNGWNRPEIGRRRVLQKVQTLDKWRWEVKE